MMWTDDPVKDAETYYSMLEKKRKETMREEGNEPSKLDYWESEHFSLDEYIDDIEKEYGYPIEEFDEDELADVVEKYTGKRPKRVYGDIEDLMILYLL